MNLRWPEPALRVHGATGRQTGRRQVVLTTMGCFVRRHGDRHTPPPRWATPDLPDRRLGGEVLEAYLRRGLSLDAIGSLTGRHPTTVGYWVKQHGLSAVHRDRHAPKGGIDRATLQALVEEGLSTREMSMRLGLSQSTVRHWLRKHRLRTDRAVRRNTVHDGAPMATMTCRRHGLTTFRLEGRGAYRCARCRSDAVAKRRRRLKQILVDEAGGRCILCGYDRYVGALEFHHRDPETKEFGIGNRGLTRSLEAVRAEAAKCVLLCANCHSEVEGGIVKIA